jgi:hypothetical protein
MGNRTRLPDMLSKLRTRAEAEALRGRYARHGAGGDLAARCGARRVTHVADPIVPEHGGGHVTAFGPGLNQEGA